MNILKEQLMMLNQMSKKSVARYHKFAHSIGISDSALGILYTLSTEDTPCSQYGLCSTWSIPKQTVNTAIAALQKKGLVTLTHVCGTRNKKNIALTDAGKAFASETVEKLYAAEIAALEALSPAEREQYVKINEKYNQALSEALDGLLSKEKGGSDLWRS